MKHALDIFHANKDAFINLDIHNHFNIPKLYSMLHYILSIQRLGSIDSLNSEGPEQLHIDYAKKGYSVSNKNDYIYQMAKWLQHQEAIDLHTAYLQWCDKQRPYDEEVKCGDEDNLELDRPESADTDGEHDMLEADHVTVTSDHSLYHIAKKTCFLQCSSSSSQAGIWCLTISSRSQIIPLRKPPWSHTRTKRI